MHVILKVLILAYYYDILLGYCSVAVTKNYINVKNCKEFQNLIFFVGSFSFCLQVRE